MPVSKWHLSVVWVTIHLLVFVLGTSYLGRAREEQVRITGDELGLPAISKEQAQLVAIATHAQVEEALRVYARDHGANNVMRCDPLDGMFAERSLSTAISAQRSVTTM